MDDPDRPADANVPTEPGCYLWRQTVGGSAVGISMLAPNGRLPAPWQPVYILPLGDIAWTLGYGKWTFAELCEKGEWGSRIPTSPRLEAMEVLCRQDPWQQAPCDDFDCIFCGERIPDSLYGARNDYHDDECSWLAAQGAADRGARGAPRQPLTTTEH